MWRLQSTKIITRQRKKDEQD
nr:unnamed protein product [Callosobruchus analis]